MKLRGLIIFVMAYALQSANPAFAAVTQIHFGTTNTPHDGLTITWTNNAGNDNIRWGYTDSCEKGSYAAQRRTYASKVLFDYTFPLVLSDTLIYYSIYDSNLGTWTAVKTFRTASLNKNSFTFKAMGDSQTDPGAWHRISSVTTPSDFTIFTGDIVATGGSVTEWNNWFREGEEFLENNLFYSAQGNHEIVDDPQALYYQNLFTLPVNPKNSELYYSFNYKNAVFICLNSSDAWSTEQYNWLLSTLEANKDVKWKIVWFHIPFFTSPVHVGEMTNFFSTWWKAFDDYGVDLIFNGHTHNYQRSVPINRKISVDSRVASYGDCPTQGRCQIVTGGSGGGSHGAGSGWFIETSTAGLHFVNADVYSNRIRIQTYNEFSERIDSFSLVKDFDPAIKASTANVCDGDLLTLTGTGADTYVWDKGVKNGVPFIPTASNTYTLNASSDEGCSRELSVNIQLSPKSYFSESYTICSNDSLYWRGKYYRTAGKHYDSLLNVQGCDSVYALQLSVIPANAYTEEAYICEGDSFLWRGTHYTLSGKYSEFLQTATGCSDSYSLDLMVVPPPEKPEISGETTVAIGQTQVYTAQVNNDNTPIWRALHGEIVSENHTQIEVLWSEPGTGTINLIIENPYACSSESVLEVAIMAANEVDSSSDDPRIPVYPNPANGSIYIDYPEDFSMEIYTLSGIKVMVSNSSPTDISSLLPGIYILRIQNEQNQWIGTQKLRVE